MTPPAPLVLEAIVDGLEQPVIVAGAEQISEGLGEAMGGAPWPVRLGFRAPGQGLADGPPPSAVIVSLLPAVGALDEPVAETDARWRAYLAGLLASGAPVFVCTVFRHVAERPKDGRPCPVLERIRRLNRLAADWSHDLGVAVIDIDRAFAHIGGRVLQTDYRLNGVLAAEVGGHAVAWALLSFGLDDLIDPDLQEKAKAALGGLQQIDVQVNRRLQRRAARRTQG